jgi:murein DD-endopeptidase MepM/ murein hydrolase activator NlpD
MKNLNYLFLFFSILAAVTLASFIFSKYTFFEFRYKLADSNLEVREPKIITNKPTVNFCNEKTIFTDERDKEFCFRGPYLIKERGLEIDLSRKKAILYDEGKIKKILNLSYQSPENVWFQSPTGLFKIRTKEKLHWSTIGLVWMPYSMQYYEDFFLHGIPYRDNGEIITSTVSGGCLRFQNEIAKEIYDFVKINDPVLVFASYDKLTPKDEFSTPLNQEESFIYQKFYNPKRIAFYFSGDRQNLKYDYYNHTGVDFKLKLGATDRNVYAIKEGEVVKIIELGEEEDYGMGNTIIIKNQIDNKTLYSLYAHLSKVREDLKEGDKIKKGEVIGEIGSSGFGCKNYWRLGKNGCESQDEIDEHLHLEIKEKPVLYNPNDGKICFNKKNESDFCYRYAPDPLFKKGYYNPLEIIFQKS